MFSAVFGLLFSSISEYADASDQEQTITLDNSAQIADANALQKAIDEVSEKVMECVEKKLASANRCFCLYPIELSEFKKKYEMVIQRNPDWQNAIVHWSTEEEATGFNLVFPALRRQVEMKCE